MSLVRTFSSVEDVRQAVARSLGFGLRGSPLTDADEEEALAVAAAAEAQAQATGGGGSAAESAIAEEAAGVEAPGGEAETSEADQALLAILEKLEAEEAPPSF